MYRSADVSEQCRRCTSFWLGSKVFPKQLRTVNGGDRVVTFNCENVFLARLCILSLPGCFPIVMSPLSLHFVHSTFFLAPCEIMGKTVFDGVWCVVYCRTIVMMNVSYCVLRFDLTANTQLSYLGWYWFQRANGRLTPNYGIPYWWMPLTHPRNSCCMCMLQIHQDPKDFGTPDHGREIQISLVIREVFIC